MNIASWLTRAGLSHPSLAAVGKGTRVVLSYGELALRAARLASGLRAAGLQPGDRVAIAARNCVEYIEIIYGIWHAGLGAVPANAKLHGRELGYILEHSGARMCFASSGLDSEIAAHTPQTLERLITIGSREYSALFSNDAMPAAARDGDDLAWLFYTSGTTGRPKGAMLTHRNLVQSSMAYLSEVDATAPRNTILHAAPLSHGSGLYMMPTLARLGINVVPDSGSFEPDEIFAAIDHWQNMSMFAAPTMVKRLVDAPGGGDPANIRTIIWGGAPMYLEDVLKALDRFGPRLAQIYGQGESPMTITLLSKAEIADRDNPHWLARLGSAGRPYACVDVIVADSDDTPLQAEETGGILVRGDVVMAGYWQNEAASAQALRNGWLHTGDVGAFDANGYLSLKDRSKDVIISGGANIYPREVEEVLLKHGKVREVSVIGRPDAEWGEVVVAYVVGEVPTTDLDALCLAEIARFKRPKAYVFVDALPKNNYGKILKTELRARDAEREKKSA
jgi:long-chain acyl-CoA synthetase